MKIPNTPHRPASLLRGLAGHLLPLVLAVLCITASIGRAELGASWQEQTFDPVSGGDHSAVMWTGSQFIAVGAQDAILTSPDGVTWTVRAPTNPQLVAPAGIASKGTSLYVALADTGGVVYTSTDTVTWAEATIGDGSESFAAIAGNSSILVAVGQREDPETFEFVPVLMTSTDGTTWTERPLPTGTGVLYEVIYSSGQFVAGGADGTILTSANGTSWTKRTTGTSYSIFYLASIGQQIVASLDDGEGLGSQGNSMLVSANGTSWTTIFATVSLPDPSDYVIVSNVDSVGSHYIATGTTAFGAENIALKSTDGSTWSVLGAPAELFRDIASNGTVAVGVGASIYLSDNLPSVSFAQEFSSAAESAGTVNVVVSLSAAASSAVTVPFTLAGTAVSPTDYTVSPASTVTFAAGETNKSIQVTLIDNSLDADDITLELTLDQPTGAHLGSLTTHTLTITDDDGPPSVSFTMDSDSAAENEGTIALAVSLSWDAPGPISVPLTITGEATDGTDYTLSTSTVNFATGERVKLLFVNLTDDSSAESIEQLILNLDSPSGAVVGGISTYTLSIYDDDSGVGSVWTRRNPLPLGGRFKDLVWTGSQAIGVTEKNIFRSSNGSAWSTSHNPVKGKATLNSVAWTGSKALAISSKVELQPGSDVYGAYVLTSSDGINWTSSFVEQLEFEVTKVIWTGTKFVAVGSEVDSDYNFGSTDVAQVATSTDGIEWTRQSLPGTSRLRDVVWTGSQIVAVGGITSENPTTGNDENSSTVVTSTDGSVWSVANTSAIKEVLQNIASGGGVLVATGWSYNSTNQSVYLSTNGTTWTKQTMGSLYSDEELMWTGTQFVALGSAVSTSTNGTSWAQTKVSSSLPGVFLEKAVWTGSQLIATGDQGQVATSPTGAVWTSRSSGVYGYSQLRSAAWSGATWVAVGGNSYTDSTFPVTKVDIYDSTVLTSPTGRNWTSRISPAKEDWQSVIWTGSQFVMAGTNGKVATSPDGMTWKIAATPVKNTLHSLASSGSLIVVLGKPLGQGSLPVLLTSPDGVKWTQQVLPPTVKNINDIAWDGTQWIGACQPDYVFVDAFIGGVAIGDVLVRSANGVNWDAFTPTDMSGLTEIEWSGTHFLAADNSGTLFASPDGSNWSEIASGVPVGNLQDLIWTGSQFIASGSNVLQTSADGEIWSPSLAEVSNYSNANKLATGGGQALLLGEELSIFSSGDVPAVAPLAVSFTTATLSVPETGKVNVQLALNAVPTAAVTVPVTLTFGTASAADIGLAPASVIFKPGETVKLVTLTVKPDVIDELNETCTLAIGTVVGAAKNRPDSCTVTILDDDQKPVITNLSDSMLVEVFADPAPEFLVTYDASPTPMLQWKRNGTPITGATASSISFPSVQLGNAGTYLVEVKNTSGTTPSAARELGVVDTINTSYSVVATGAKATLKAPAAGTAGTLTFQWNRDGTPVTNDSGSSPRISGATTATLTINAVTDADAGSYSCTVTQTSTSTTLETAANTLIVTTGKPQLDAIDPVTGRLGEVFTQGITFDPDTTKQPNTIVVTGLPKGLAYSPSYGEIRGVATQAVTNKAITVTATNAHGNHSITFLLTIEPLNATMVGNYHGHILRHAGPVEEAWPGADLGARIEVNVSAVGMATGKVVNGSTTMPFSAQLTAQSGDSTFAVIAPLAGPKGQRILMSLQFTADSNSLTGELSANSTSLPVAGWRESWTAANPATDFKGKINFTLKPGEEPDPIAHFRPGGVGFGSFTVAASGRFDVKGKLPDGTAFLSNTFLGPNGEVLIYQTLYAIPGSVVGNLLLMPESGKAGALDAGSSSLTMNKPAQYPDLSKPTPYPDGITLISLQVNGGLYVPPAAGEVILGLEDIADNAQVTLSGGGFEASSLAMFDGSVYTPAFNNILRIKSGGAVVLPTPNDSSLSLIVKPATGDFSGTITFTDSNPSYQGPRTLVRKAAFSGIIISSPATPEAAGHFLLQQLPGYDQHPASTPWYTGAIMLEAAMGGGIE